MFVVSLELTDGRMWAVQVIARDRTHACAVATYNVEKRFAGSCVLRCVRIQEA